jgi:FixJ family two-component response regulator
MTLAADADPIVYLVDDDAGARAALVALLEARGLRVEAFPTLGQYLAAPRQDAPACLVLDVSLPDSNGLDFQTRLDRRHPPLVMITGCGDVRASVEAMRQGAVDYLVKPFDETALLRAIKTALEQDRTRRVDSAEHAILATRLASLSPREYEVLRLVVSGYLNKQAANALGIREVTLQTHRSSVMRKMQAASLADLVRLADRLEVPLISAIGASRSAGR